MIPKTVVDEIRRLLREKRYSQRKIASRLGVSRGTVNSIATGKRSNNAGRENAENAADNDLITPSGLPQRCPTCGAKVMIPCLACQIRARMKCQKELMNYG